MDGYCLVVNCRQHGFVGKIRIVTGLDYITQDTKFANLWHKHRIDVENKTVLERFEKDRKPIETIPENKCQPKPWARRFK